MAVTLAAIALSGDGGGATGVPVAPTVSDPPLLGTDPSWRLQRAMARGAARRAMAGFAARLVADPRSTEAAIGLVHAAHRGGGGPWARSFLEALARRWDVAALHLALAEAAYLDGDVQTGWRRALRARRRGPDRPETGLAEAAGRIGLGDLTGAVTALAGLHTSTDPDADPSLRSALIRDRRARLLLIFDPELSGRSARRRAWRHGMRTGDPWVRIRSLLLAAASDGAAGRSGAGRRAAARARGLAVRLGDAVTTSLAISTEIDLDDRAASPDGDAQPRLEASCELLPAVARRLRVDCRLTRIRRLWRVGDPTGALEILDESIPDPPGTVDPVTVLRIADTAISLQQTTGDVVAARRWAEAAVAASRRLGDSGRLEHFTTRLVAIRRIDGGDAGTDRRAGVRPGGGGGVPGEGPLRRARRAWAAGDPRAAVAALSRLIGADPGPGEEPGARLSVRGRPATVVRQVLAGRGHEEEGRIGAAGRAYRKAVRELSGWLEELEEPVVRAGVIDVWSGLHRRLAAVELAAGRTDAALATLDLARRLDAGGTLGASRAPLDAVAGDGPPVARDPAVPGDPGLPGWLGDDLGVVSYGFLDFEVWAWVVRRDRTVALRLPIDSEELAHAVGLWRLMISRDAPASRRHPVGRRLARALLEPLEASVALDGVRVLIVVPDGALHGLPFAALPLDRAGSRLYGDRYVWVRNSSLRSMGRAWSRPPRGGPVVAFASSGGPRTALELSSVALSGGLVFRGARSTETRFRRMAGRASVIHVAGHAATPAAPFRGGGLSFRGDRRGDGTLSAREILELELDGAAVVLLGCDTGTRPPASVRRGPAGVPSSLAEAFLEAGARVVVGNLWEIDETGTSFIAGQLYAEGGPGAGPGSLAAARRRARERWPERPSRWAGLVWIGAPSLAAPESPHATTDRRETHGQ